MIEGKDDYALDFWKQPAEAGNGYQSGDIHGDNCNPEGLLHNRRFISALMFDPLLKLLLILKTLPFFSFFPSSVPLICTRVL